MLKRLKWKRKRSSIAVLVLSVFALGALGTAAPSAFADESIFGGDFDSTLSDIGNTMNGVGNDVQNFFGRVVRSVTDDSSAPSPSQQPQQPSQPLQLGAPQQNPAPAQPAAAPVAPKPRYNPADAGLGAGNLPLQKSFEISDIRTADSSLVLQGKLPPGTTWVMITVKKQGSDGGAKSTMSAPARLTSRVYLSEGPGRYQVGIFGTSRADRAGSYDGYATFTVENTDTRDLLYLLPSTSIQSDSPEIRDLAARLTANAPTDRDKLNAIHDWVANNIAYDAQGYYSGTYGEKPVDALEVLHRGFTVCEGYSNLTAALLRAAGIRAKVAMGTAATSALVSANATMSPGAGGSHAWNEAYVDGRWVLIDTTWDAGYINPTGFVRNPTRTYLDMDPAEFQKTHFKTEDKLI